MRKRSLLVLVVGMVAAAVVAPASFAASSKLQLVRTHHSLTGTHLWYAQTVGGYPVDGAYYAKHLDRAGRLVSVADGRLKVGGALPSLARISRNDARAIAAAGTRSGKLVVVPGKHARLAWAVLSRSGVRTLVDAVSGRTISRANTVKYATGQGRIFLPNPVATLGDESLTDQGDTDYAALQPAYVTKPLTNLDGSGFLRGDYANISGTTSPAASANLQFLFGRTSDSFEQTMAYYDITTAQLYLRSLGFTDVNSEPQDVKVNQLGVDNSYYSPNQDVIKFGKGGVDDAEDAEVIWHELGHAIQDSQVAGFGTTTESGAIGEGFGDYWAFTMSVPVSPGGSDTACIADWDAVSYTSAVPHCLRRVDSSLHWPENAHPTGEVHANGRIWSRALWDVQRAVGRTIADRSIIEGQYSYTPDVTFAGASQATVAAAQALYGAKTAAKVKQAFVDRGFIQ